MTTPPVYVDRRQARNAQMRADFATMQKKHLSHTHIVDTLSAKYYLAPSTVYAIVGATGRYRTADQPSQHSNQAQA